MRFIGLIALTLALLAGCAPQPKPTIDDDARAAAHAPPSTANSAAPAVDPAATTPNDVAKSAVAGGGVSVEFFLTEDPVLAQGRVPGVRIKGTRTEVYLKPPAFLDQTSIASASIVKPPEIDSHYVQVNFSDEGAAVMQNVTSTNIGAQIAIVVDGQVVVAPVVRGAITRSAYIAGRFTHAEAESLAARLNASAKR